MIKKKVSGKANRAAGHNYERDKRKQLVPLYPHIITTRNGSRFRDAEGVDFMNANEHVNGRLPYNIQCKKAIGSKVNYRGLLNSLPEDSGVINVV